MSINSLSINTVLGLTIFIAVTANYTAAIGQTDPEINQIISQNTNYPRRQSQPNLNLTPEQQQKIQQIRDRNYDQIAKTQQELQIAREKLRTMLSGSDSLNAIRNQHNQVLVLSEKLASLNFESLLQIRSVLDNNQKTKFAETMEVDPSDNQTNDFWQF